MALEVVTVGIPVDCFLFLQLICCCPRCTSLDHLFQDPCPSFVLFILAYQENKEHHALFQLAAAQPNRVKTQVRIGERYLLTFINVKRLVSNYILSKPMIQIRTHRRGQRFDKHFIEVKTLMANNV